MKDGGIFKPANVFKASQSPVSPPNSWEKRKCLSAPVFSPSKWKGCFLTHWKLWSRSRMTEDVFRLREKGTPVGKCNSSEEGMTVWIQNKWGAERSPWAWNSNHVKYWCIQTGRQIPAPALCHGKPEPAFPQELLRRWDPAGAKPWGNVLGRKDEGENVTLSEGLSYKHHLATPSHRKGNKDNRVQVQSRKWDFFPRK